MKKTRIAVVGGGPGGYVAAIRAAQLGAEVTLIERGEVGGTCLNVGCIPTKCMLHSAELFSTICEQSAERGITVKEAQVDFTKVLAYKEKQSRKLRMGVAQLLKKNCVKLVEGTARFTGRKTLEVLTGDGKCEQLQPDKIILATGSRNVTPPIQGLRDSKHCIDSTGALSLQTIPKSMAVIGGGVIGTELACVYAAFGTAVTILEMQPTILPLMDREISEFASKSIKKAGTHIETEATVQMIKDDRTHAALSFRRKNGEEATIVAEKVLVAVGRQANTEGLCLEASGVKSEKGYIPVDDNMQTNVEGVYAIGDCALGKLQLAHAASAMGEVAAENAMGGSACYVQHTCPNCVYIEPELAGAGLTEEQAKQQGIAYKVGKFPLAANGRSLIANGGNGMVKILAGVRHGEILGMHIAGPRATELIAQGVLCMQLEATVNEVIETIFAHPTVSEAVREAALDMEGRAIHIGGNATSRPVGL